MSTPYLLPLLLFLCISLHACNARNLGPLNKNLQQKSHFSAVKSDEKNGFGSSSKKLKEDSNNKVETHLVADKSEKPINQRVHKAIGKAYSWRLPHDDKKPREEHPEFNLDYAPPKTHPPHHN